MGGLTLFGFPIASSRLLQYSTTVPVDFGKPVCYDTHTVIECTLRDLETGDDYKAPFDMYT